ncbi:CPBP family intramembrane glutamic endopeptidase [Salinithrix halophila]|uniref:CPBP family intramembrane glutamic endopeptidase n=1 Tax=Salinithrix halophila TaxID=1485204 RepID=A0ABV8JI38_9BACL
MKWIILLAKIALTFLLAFSGTLLLTLLLALWFDPKASLIPLIFAQNAAFAIAACLAWRWFEKEPLERMGFFDPFPLRAFFRGTAAGVGLIGGVFLLLWLTPWMEVTGIRIDKASLSSILYAAAGFLVVATGEEIFTRGWLQTLLQKHLGAIGGMLTASLFFSALHLDNPHISNLSLINLFAAGVLLGAARLASGSLWLPIGLHFSWNWTQEIVSLPVSGLHMTKAPPVKAAETGPDWITGGPFGLEGGLGAFLVLVMGCWYFTRLYRKKNPQI